MKRKIVVPHITVLHTERGYGQHDSRKELSERHETALAVLQNYNGSFEELKTSLSWRQSTALGVLVKLKQKGYVSFDWSFAE